jgi:DUF2924 family protein
MRDSTEMMHEAPAHRGRRGAHWITMDAIDTRSGASLRDPAHSAAQGISEQIVVLQQLGLAGLRAEWRRLFRTQPPSLSRDLVMRAIAYRLQEVTHGGLAKATVRKLGSLAAALEADGEIGLVSGPQIKPGARLVREWRGRTHTVTVTDEGFDYNGRHYPSLTKVARAITGAHWSGPRFFGLKKPEPRERPTRAQQAPASAPQGSEEAGDA